MKQLRESKPWRGIAAPTPHMQENREMDLLAPSYSASKSQTWEFNTNIPSWWPGMNPLTKLPVFGAGGAAGQQILPSQILRGL